MTYRIGSKFLGSPSLQTTSTTNQEILPSPDENWTMPYKFYKFSFYNDQDCTIKINGENSIYLRSGQGISTSEVDTLIYSLVVVEQNITFNWIGAY